MAAQASSLALEGYDAITFFEGRKPRRGSFDYKMQLDGLTYCFLSEEHLNRFKKTPRAFLPQFGGHCALAVGLYGGLRPGSANSWKVVDEKLYFLGGPNTFWLWEKFPNLITRAHQQYRGR